MAFFQDTRPSREPFLNAPASVLILIGVLLAAHVARVLLPEADANELLTTYAFIPARYSPAALAANGFAPASLYSQIVTFITYMFLHGSFLHVGVNCLWLLAFGPSVARRLGTVLFYIFFLVCGVAAALLHLALNWGAIIPVVGASGAIAGLMGAGIRILYRDRRLRLGERPKLAPVFTGPVLFFSAMWVVVNIIAGVTGLGTNGGELGIVAWQAHLGGYFAGLFLIGWFDLLSNRRMKPVKLEP